MKHWSHLLDLGDDAEVETRLRNRVGHIFQPEISVMIQIFKWKNPSDFI